MARTARLAYDNLVYAATITASSEADGYAATNLLSSSRWRKYRSATSTGNQNVDIDFLAAKNVTAVLLADVKGHTGGTVKVQRWNGSSFVDQATPTNPSTNPNKIIGAWFTVQNPTKWRILFTNTAVVNEYVELGVVFIGTYFQPTYSLTPKYGLNRIDPSVVLRVPGGQRTAERRTPWWQINGSFDVEPEADRAPFVALSEMVGTHTPFFFAINPDDPAYMVMYGRFDNGLNFAHINPSYFGIQFSFTEDV